MRVRVLATLLTQTAALHASPTIRRSAGPSPAAIGSIKMSESLAVTITKAGIGLAAQPVVWYSLFTLRTTGCGLPSGSIVQTLEGSSYLVVAGFALAGLATRVRKGAGLEAAELAAAEAEADALAAATALAAAAAKTTPADRRAAAQRSAAVAEEKQRLSQEKVAAVPDAARLLGLGESLSYLTAAAGLVVGALQLLEVGSLPSAVPVAGSVCWS